MTEIDHRPLNVKYIFSMFICQEVVQIYLIQRVHKTWDMISKKEKPLQIFRKKQIFVNCFYICVGPSRICGIQFKEEFSLRSIVAFSLSAM